MRSFLTEKSELTQDIIFIWILLGLIKIFWRRIRMLFLLKTKARTMFLIFLMNTMNQTLKLRVHLLFFTTLQQPCFAWMFQSQWRTINERNLLLKLLNRGIKSAHQKRANHLLGTLPVAWKNPVQLQSYCKSRFKPYNLCRDWVPILLQRLISRSLTYHVV